MIRGHFLRRFLSNSKKTTESIYETAWGSNWPEMVPEETGTPVTVRLPRTHSRIDPHTHKQKPDYIFDKTPNKDEQT